MSDITFKCPICQQTLTVPIMPDQPPSPSGEHCILAAMLNDKRWAISEMIQLADRCKEMN